tara:strand:- start:261 stop:434 length:174 start_codon:yes stop_codon:yes gene_type:complete
MENKYSIEEILEAVNDLQQLKKDKIIEKLTKKAVINKNSEIPKNTLRLIEEAEKSKD